MFSQISLFDVHLRRTKSLLSLNLSDYLLRIESESLHFTTKTNNPATSSSFSFNGYKENILGIAYEVWYICGQYFKNCSSPLYHKIQR